MSTDLVPVLRELRELGRFDQAAALVQKADPRTMTPQLHSAAGTALAAVSQYDAAAVHLLLASVDVALAPGALATLADLAWIKHDYVRGRAFAIEGLALDPSDHNCRIQLHRNESGLARGQRNLRGKLAHAAFFADPQGNAGDLALTDAVRRCFRTGTGTDSWHGVHVHQLFDERRLAEVNAADALIVGGGGLFLPDTAPNGNSGWQWNIADDVLRRIEVPLAVFAVGYNLFEGQTFAGDGGQEGPGSQGPPAGERRGSRFTRSLATLVERSIFFGLRNHGSVDRIRDLLPAELAEKVRWQPCPTTFSGLLAEEPADPVPGAGAGGPVLLNCAYDRAGRRFGDGYGQFLTQLRDWVLSTRERAEVRYAAHCVADEKLVIDLRREHGITLPVEALYDRTVAGITDTYRRARLVVGMRGHAGMIPFGVGTPIISLISHPKLGYFLDDIERPEWGLSIRDPQLGGRLQELTATLLDTHSDVVADIGRIQRRLYDVTARNIRSLPSVLHADGRIGQDAERE